MQRLLFRDDITFTSEAMSQRDVAGDYTETTGSQAVQVAVQINSPMLSQDASDFAGLVYSEVF